MRQAIGKERTMNNKEDETYGAKCVCTDEPPYQECSEHNGY
jgi:hypothetical protein